MNTEMESKSLVLYDRDIREPLFDYLEEYRQDQDV